MKRPAFIALFFFCMAQTLFAQEKTDDYNRLIREAGAYMNRGEYREAIPLLDSCIFLDTTKAEVLNWRACATIYQAPVNEPGNNREAIRFFNKAIALDPLNYGYYANRAFAWQNLNQLKQSYSDYKKALSLDTLNVELHGNVLRSLWIQNRNKEALAYSGEIINKFPEHGYAWYVQGQLKRDYLHQYAAGNKDIKKSEELGWEQGIRLYY